MSLWILTDWVKCTCIYSGQITTENSLKSMHLTHLQDLLKRWVDAAWDYLWDIPIWNPLIHGTDIFSKLQLLGVKNILCLQKNLFVIVFVYLVFSFNVNNLFYRIYLFILIDVIFSWPILFLLYDRILRFQVTLLKLWTVNCSCTS